MCGKGETEQGRNKSAVQGRYRGRTSDRVVKWTFQCGRLADKKLWKGRRKTSVREMKNR